MFSKILYHMLMKFGVRNITIIIVCLETSSCFEKAKSLVWVICMHNCFSYLSICGQLKCLYE
ncbi:hypothetical protein HanRHA438_Chr16g0759771 [Helianthus annuus]|nr:hypothetical protein HanRHA438_Chr16g0759771 [Helianthus annuus]